MPNALVIAPVLSLDAASDARQVGGKATGLHRLLRLGVRVPRGVVITASSAESFSDENIPADVWQAIVDAWRALKAEVVIVRSSAIGEDSAEASFAGQLDSIADVGSHRELRDAILRCWKSRWSDRVVSYERSRGHALRAMAIIVQQQIRASVSGVLFTQDPSGSDGALLEFCAGSGETLVGGRINPGRIRVERSSAVQRLASATDASLDDETVRTLAAEGRRIAEAFGAPQDIEWAMDAAGHAWFVQARPITVKVDAVNGKRRVLWSNANVNENFPDPVCPLLYSVAAAGYYHYFLNLGRAFGLSRRRLAAIDEPLRQIIGVHGARMYYNLSSVHTVLRAAPFGNELVAAFNQFVGADEVRPDEGSKHGWRATQALELVRIAACVTWQCLFLTRRVEEFERTVDDYGRRTKLAMLPRLDRAELRDRLRGFMSIRRHRWKNASLADAGSMVCYAALKAFLRRVLPGEKQEALHNKLLKALPGLASSMPAIELWKLSRMIRADRELAALFQRATPEATLAELRLNPRFAAFQHALDTYLDDWGFRCSGELMLTAPSFQENAAPLVSILQSYATCNGESPEQLLVCQQAERVDETAHVLRLVGWPRSIALRVLLSWTQRSIQLRERARLKQALLYSRLRRVALAVGDDLCAERRLERRDDVFMLTIDELDTLLSGSAMFPDLRVQIAARRQAHAELSARRPPNAFVLPQGHYFVPGDEGDAVPGASTPVLTGTSACGGKATARATVLADVTDAHQLRPGDILVTKQTDPGWGPVFPLISGLVLERGGMLSHGAIIAREFGIPSIVGVADATRLIPTSTRVYVDGDRGCVHLLEERD